MIINKVIKGVNMRGEFLGMGKRSEEKGQGKERMIEEVKINKAHCGYHNETSVCDTC